MRSVQGNPLVTDAIPELAHVATPRNSTRIRDARIRQHFMEPALMSTGVETTGAEGSAIRAFTLERMLVELLRNAGALPLDYYKELVSLRDTLPGEASRRGSLP